MNVSGFSCSSVSLRCDTLSPDQPHKQWATEVRRRVDLTSETLTKARLAFT
jgi:hypothetical protein